MPIAGVQSEEHIVEAERKGQVDVPGAIFKHKLKSLRDWKLTE
jgi:hypothetical protein